MDAGRVGELEIHVLVYCVCRTSRKINIKRFQYIQCLFHFMSIMSNKLNKFIYILFKRMSNMSNINLAKIKSIECLIQFRGN